MVPPIAVYILLSALLVILSSIGARMLSGRGQRFLRIMRRLFIAALLITVGSVLGPWLLKHLYAYRPALTDTRETLFEGIEYIRDVRSDPRPLVIHTVTVDLDAGGIRFLVTPPDPPDKHEMIARTTSQFLTEFGVQLAINGDFFYPWRDFGLLDYYPHAGDPVDVLGFASSEGTVYSDVRANHSTIFLWENNRVTFDERIGEVYNALSGNVIIVREGRPYNLESSHSYYLKPHPRTAIGVDATSKMLIIIVIDGRQPGYSEGATMKELADIIIEYGGDIALNLDGGGSSALVIEGEEGEPLLLSSPIHTNIPYRERPVANHLGIFAQRLDD